MQRGGCRVRCAGGSSARLPPHAGGGSLLGCGDTATGVAASQVWADQRAVVLFKSRQDDVAAVGGSCSGSGAVPGTGASGAQWQASAVLRFARLSRDRLPRRRVLRSRRSAPRRGAQYAREHKRLANYRPTESTASHLAANHRQRDSHGRFTSDTAGEPRLSLRLSVSPSLRLSPSVLHSMSDRCLVAACGQAPGLKSMRSFCLRANEIDGTSTDGAIVAYYCARPLRCVVV